MGVVGGIVTFLIVWWAVLFTVLPLGVRNQPRASESVPGADPGAPENPQMWFKLGLTTLITLAIWLVMFLAIELKVIDLAGIDAASDESR